MKAATLLTGLTMLAAPAARAQTVLVGDSTYQGLQPRRDSLASVVARLGRHCQRRELLGWYTAKLRSGGCLTGTQVVGHALHYRRLQASFCLDDDTGELRDIRFGPGAPVVTARGIRPGVGTFAEVVAQYGPPGGSSPPDGQPRASSYSQDRQAYYTTLRYPHIWFVSRGRRVAGENLLARPVQEIWLR